MKLLTIRTLHLEKQNVADEIVKATLKLFVVLSLVPGGELSFDLPLGGELRFEFMAAMVLWPEEMAFNKFTTLAK